MTVVAACNKSGPEIDVAAEVAGSYVGTTSASFQYSPEPMVTENETFNITAAGEGLVDVSYESSTWGAFSFEGVSVSGTDPYSLKGDGTTLMGMGETKNEYAALMEDQRTIMLFGKGLVERLTTVDI